MASGTIKSYTRPSGSFGEGAHWSFEWSSTKKAEGVSTVSWSLYTRGRTVSPTWLETGCWLSVGKNGTTTQLYAKEHTEGADCSFVDKFRASGSFDVVHTTSGYASFTVYFEVYIYEYEHKTNSVMGILDSLPTVTSKPPVVTGTVVDVNPTTCSLTGDPSKLVKFYSAAQATMSATAQNGAALDESLYIIRNGSRTGYGTIYTFDNVESNEFTFSAEDDRGNVGTDAVTPTMIPYVKLTCNMSNNKPDGDGDMSVVCFGNFFKGSFGAVPNTLRVQYRYKVSGGSFGGWNDMAATTSGNEYIASAHLTGLNYQLPYIFECRAIDKLATVSSGATTVISKPLFHWSAHDFVFEVPVTFNKGAEGLPLDGTWIPTLHSDAVDFYTFQNGWYSKVNQTVTVGFYIKASCFGLEDYMPIKISGLPFTPAIPAAGGGMCSGANVSGGFTFQCFVAETNGTITTRVQACNNTTATELATSASGCVYPSSSREVTLSGTITFMSSE